MYCPSCGKQIPDDSLFCEFCGARGAAVQAAMPVTQAAPIGVPAALNREQLAATLLKSMTLGEKFVAFGALAGILGFFLPWGSIPNLAGLDLQNLIANGPGRLVTNSVSGFDMARMWGGVYFVLLGALGAGALFLVGGKAPLPRKRSINAFQILIGALVGPQFLFTILFVPMGQQVAGIGLWLTCLGYCAIAAGGIVSTFHLSNQAQ
jgi:hypothetical protein